MVKIKLEGHREFLAALRAYHRSTGKAFEKASAWAAERVLALTEPTVPMETGALRASAGWVQEGKGWNTVTWVGYGFPVSGFFRGSQEKHPELYAVWQHEVPAKEYTTPGTHHLYLQMGLLEHEKHISDIFYQYMVRA